MVMCAAAVDLGVGGLPPVLGVAAMQDEDYLLIQKPLSVLLVDLQVVSILYVPPVEADMCTNLTNYVICMNFKCIQHHNSVITVLLFEHMICSDSF